MGLVGLVALHRMEYTAYPRKAIQVTLSCYNMRMSLSINEFRTLAGRIQANLSGAKLARILEVAPGCISMRFDTPALEPVLVIAAHPRFSTIFTSPLEPPLLDLKQSQQAINASFAKAMEYTVGMAKLVSAEMPRKDDRILRLKFLSEDKYGDTKIRVMQIELTGRIAHIFLLTETETVISSLRRLYRPGTKEYKTSPRPIAAGMPLPPPPPPPERHESEEAQPFEVANMRERAAFGEFQSVLSHEAPRAASDTSKFKQEAIARELELAHEAVAALDMLGHFMLAPAGIRTMLRDAGCKNLADALEERGYIDEPIDFNQLIAYLQRLSGNAKKLAALALESASAPAKMKKQQAAPSMKDKPDGVSAKLQLFSHKVKRLRTLGGFDLIVTYSAEGNYAALKAFPSPENLWFHARDYSGGYVIMLTGKRAPDPHDIEQAAVVAAANSKGRDEATIDVCYTMLKYLRKPKDAKTGTILKTQETVIAVRPSAFAELRSQLAVER